MQSNLIIQVGLKLWGKSQLSTEDTLISRRVMCLVGSFIVNYIKVAARCDKDQSSHILNATLILQDKWQTALLKSNLCIYLFFPQDHFLIVSNNIPYAGKIPT